MAVEAQVELVDLSQEIYEGMPLYAGHLETSIFEHVSHEETSARFDGGFSYAANGLTLSEHGPTHVDAISHLDPAPGAPSIDQMPLDSFYGPGTCVDVSGVGPDELVTETHLDVAEAQAGGLLRSGDVLLIHTGAFRRNGGTPAYSSDYTGLDDSAAQWLADRDVKVFGVDAPSPDHPRSRTYPVHMMCRERGITHYENLANLDRLVGRRFTFAGFPLRIRGGTGSPVRAVALLTD
jgi:kynurenine formamidase